MCDTPTEVAPAFITSVFIGNNRSAVNHAGAFVPLYAYVISRSVHKRSAEHSLIAYIKMLLREPVKFLFRIDV